MVQQQQELSETLEAVSVISSVSRALDPYSLSNDLEVRYGKDECGSTGINDGSFGYMVGGVTSGSRQGHITTKELEERWGGKI